jgi:hypothetical protein
MSGHFMEKWMRPVLTTLLILEMISISGSFNVFRLVASKAKGEERIISVQNSDKEEDKEESDSHYGQLLKALKEKVDGWLKSLNERIEREDVTRFEVRFLEILRNILEWVKEKIDSKIESWEEKKPGKKEKGLFQDTHQTLFLYFEIG